MFVYMYYVSICIDIIFISVQAASRRAAFL